MITEDILSITLTIKQQLFLAKVLKRFIHLGALGYESISTIKPLKYSPSPTPWMIMSMTILIKDVLESNKYNSALARLLNIIAEIYKMDKMKLVTYEKAEQTTDGGLFYKPDDWYNILYEVEKLNQI